MRIVFFFPLLNFPNFTLQERANRSSHIVGYLVPLLSSVFGTIMCAHVGRVETH